MPQVKKEIASEVYLQKAVLEGYRTIKKLKVEFLHGLNVIIGKNGSGKTNLMKYLYQALDIEANQQLLNAEIILGKASSLEALPLRMIRKVQYETNPSNILRNSQLAYNVKMKMSIGQGDFEDFNHFLDVYVFQKEHGYLYDAQLIRHGIRIISIFLINLLTTLVP
jgi:recombinational DNA repair ATPase RecF